MSTLRCDRCGNTYNSEAPAGYKLGDLHLKAVSGLSTGVCGGVIVLGSEEQDYVTLLACTNPQRALVAVMHYNKADDSYQGKKFSEPLSKRGAEALAESWAAALGLEVR